MGQAPWREAMVLRRNPRAKYVRLKIHPPGRVEVVMPSGFDERGLPVILDQHTAWVEERLLHLSGQPVELQGPPSRIKLPAIDDQWRLEYMPRGGTRNSCRERTDGVLTVSADNDEQRRELLKRWLARKAKQQLIPWLKETSDELALPFSGVTIRGQRTRWGSCSAKGHINLNYALLFLQPDLVRYLFVHELCHTVHLNHSHRYWALVQGKEPHYRIMEKALKRAAYEVPAWLHAPFYDVQA
ncbi:MAG: SprT family zinc-dependent metalloprotease [Pseudomonadota bacterium]